MLKILKYLWLHKVISVILLIVLSLAILLTVFYSPKSYYKYLRGKDVESVSYVFMDKGGSRYYKGIIDPSRYEELKEVLKDGKYSRGLIQNKGKLTYYHLEIVYSNGKTVTFNDRFISNIQLGGIRKSTLNCDSLRELVDENNLILVYERIPS